MIKKIATMGRKWGVHLVIATQRPDNQTISAQIRANLPESFAFRVRDERNSRILNVKGVRG